MPFYCLAACVNENPFDNSNGGLDPAEFARRSVSKLLTEQLNNLAGGLIAGVDINFDLTTASDYTTGENVTAQILMGTYQTLAGRSFNSNCYEQL